MDGKTIIKLLKKEGWVCASSKGSHFKMRKDGKMAIVPVHGKKDLPEGTLKSIEKTTGVKLK
ncbi:type II toxin-antitoxin system HicA family toxin [Piscirickettsia salmonis]|uniref:type II toxin-antitoxin system HicA family toxin n=1 Tax=Piscirickettsia salmonis TaxID=1238 RepID=UPI003EBFE4AF